MEPDAKAASHSPTGSRTAPGEGGITGWAQVHGLRGQTSIADRAEFDNHYIQNWSSSLDFKILLLTVLAVLRTAED